MARGHHSGCGWTACLAYHIPTYGTTQSNSILGGAMARGRQDNDCEGSLPLHFICSINAPFEVNHQPPGDDLATLFTLLGCCSCSCFWYNPLIIRVPVHISAQQLGRDTCCPVGKKTECRNRCFLALSLSAPPAGHCSLEQLLQLQTARLKIQHHAHHHW
jgi:hypothetical protein